MNKNPIVYDEDQLEEIEQFIETQWGAGENGYVCHELTSEYVHTDIQVNGDDEGTILSTFGMGARAINSPLPDFEHIELLMYASPILAEDSANDHSRVLTACAELVRLSKYPFREDSWIGPGHTIDASDEFCETFGYPYFLFLEYPYKATVTGVGKITYLVVVPVFEDEVTQMIEREEYATFMQDYYAYFENLKYEKNIFHIDVKRPHLTEQ